jgi:hypothetical protein
VRLRRIHQHLAHNIVAALIDLRAGFDFGFNLSLLRFRSAGAFLGTVMADEPQSDKTKLVIPYFQSRTKPHDISAELAQELAAILIEWGSFENAIVLDLDQLRQYPQVKKLAEDVPYGFARKIELWKRSVYALFKGIPFYKNTAREICSKGKIVAAKRHRVVHGHWRPHKDKPGTFQVVFGFDRRQVLGAYDVDLKFAADLHRDIKTMTEAVYSFLISRMMHASQGLLTARVGPELASPARPSAPKREKPSPRRKPSRA